MPIVDREPGTPFPGVIGRTIEESSPGGLSETPRRHAQTSIDLRSVRSHSPATRVAAPSIVAAVGP